MNKRIFENPILKEVLESLTKRETIFISPPLERNEKEYYGSLFKQYAPSGSICFLSSGSSGNPKLIVHSIETLLKRASDQAKELGLNNESHYLSPLPIHHLGGFMPILRCNSTGAKLTIKKKDQNLCELIELIRPTHISLVPTQLDQVIKNNQNLDFLDCLLLGGAGCPDALIKKAKDLSYPVRACYGMTETASFFSISSIKDFFETGEFKLKLMDNWNAYAQDSGRLTIESDEMFLGTITGKGFQASNGMLPTFDIGNVDPPYINIYGRSDLVFKSGGEKVDPLEVENKIKAIFNTEDIIVVPKEDSKWGHVTCAFLSPFDTNIDYASYVKGLPAHQRPKFFFKLEETEGIKPKRSQLIEKLNSLSCMPKVAFIHGFMGEQDDLLELSKSLPIAPSLWSLPDHGKAPSFNSFEDAIKYYSEKVIQEQIDILYGYSMGGRLALAVAENLASLKTPLKGLILESSHPGIENKDDRNLRFNQDKKLFDRFPKEPEEFFNAWYSLPLFGDFKNSDAGAKKLVSMNKNWSPSSWATAMLALSTGHQEDYRNFIYDCPHPILYLCGDKDEKYKKLGQELLSQASESLTLKCLENGFHNLHGQHKKNLLGPITSFLNTCN